MVSHLVEALFSLAVALFRRGQGCGEIEAGRGGVTSTAEKDSSRQIICSSVGHPADVCWLRYGARMSSREVYVHIRIY